MNEGQLSWLFPQCSHLRNKMRRQYAWVTSSHSFQNLCTSPKLPTPVNYNMWLTYTKGYNRYVLNYLFQLPRDIRALLGVEIYVSFSGAMQAFLIPSFISVTAMLKYCMGFVFFWGCFFFFGSHRSFMASFMKSGNCGRDSTMFLLMTI